MADDLRAALDKYETVLERVVLFLDSLVVRANAAPAMDATRENAIHECNVRAIYVGRHGDPHVSDLHDGTRPAGITRLRINQNIPGAPIR